MKRFFEDNWGQIIAVMVAFFVCMWFTIGIIYALYNPSPPRTTEQQYIDQCSRLDKIANTNTDIWTCEK